MQELDQLHEVIKAQSLQLEAAISQVDQYQMEVQHLRQQIVQVEQQLRSVMAPTYLPHDRDRAARDQQVGCFPPERLFLARWRWQDRLYDYFQTRRYFRVFCVLR